MRVKTEKICAEILIYSTFLNAIAFLQVSMSVRPILTLSKYKKDDLYLTVKQLVAVQLRIAAFHIVSKW